MYTPFSLPHVDFPLLLNSPHSGAAYAPEFLAQSRLTPFNLRKAEDCYVDELFFNAHTPSLKANFPRSFLDVNREPYELDPLLIHEPLPVFANLFSEKVKVGLGTLPRFGAEGKAIYAQKIALAEALSRIETCYFPYHAALHDALEHLHNTFGFAVLLDCHSMPHAATRHSGVDIVLGDRFGTSCAPALTQFVEQFFESKGYAVALNSPFAGGFITQHYGRPSLGYHALQIEVSRKLYMNEKTLEKTNTFTRLQCNVQELVSAIKKEPFLTKELQV